MNRRQFLKALGLAPLALGVGNALSFADSRKDPLRGLRIIDAHAHPDRLRLTKHEPDDSTSVSAMTEMGMAASVFAAVGDRVYLSGGRLPGPEHLQTMRQLNFWKDGIVKSGNVKLILKSSDITKAPKPGDTPGCILAIEGGDPLAGNPDRVNEFYDYGVRLITLIHYSNNQLGDCMKNWT